MMSRALDDSGQDLIEYGFLAAMISVFLLSAVVTLGDSINKILWEMNVTVPVP